MFACFTFIFVRFRRGHEQALRKEGRGGGECASRHRYRKRNNNASCHFVFHRLRLRPFAPPPVSLSFYREHNSYLPRKTCLKSSRPNICAPSAAPLTDCRVSNIDSPRSIRPFFSRYNVAQFGNRVYALELDISGTTGCEYWIVKVLEGKILEILRYFSSFVLLVSLIDRRWDG